MVRFVGRNDVTQVQSWIDEWAATLAGWMRQDLHPIIFHPQPGRCVRSRVCTSPVAGDSGADSRSAFTTHLGRRSRTESAEDAADAVFVTKDR